ncbi:hypothetical protein ACFLT9_01280 [Acidobacteriota bacterium]
MNPGENSMIFAVIVLNLVFIVLLIRFFTSWIRIRHRSKMYNVLLNKFGGPQDLTEFINTEGGGNFIDKLSVGKVSSKEKILNNVIVGIIITFLGVALVLVSLIYEKWSQELLIFGVLAGLTGLGFLVSSYMSYILSRRWDLFE